MNNYSDKFAFNNEINIMKINNSINSIKFYEKGNINLFMYFIM